MSESNEESQWVDVDLVPTIERKEGWLPEILLY